MLDLINDIRREVGVQPLESEHNTAKLVWLGRAVKIGTTVGVVVAIAAAIFGYMALVLTALALSAACMITKVIVDRKKAEIKSDIHSKVYASFNDITSKTNPNSSVDHKKIQEKHLKAIEAKEEEIFRVRSSKSIEIKQMKDELEKLKLSYQDLEKVHLESIRLKEEEIRSKEGEINASAESIRSKEGEIYTHIESIRLKDEENSKLRTELADKDEEIRKLEEFISLAKSFSQHATKFGQIIEKVEPRTPPKKDTSTPIAHNTPPPQFNIDNVVNQPPEEVVV